MKLNVDAHVKLMTRTVLKKSVVVKGTQAWYFRTKVMQLQFRYPAKHSPRLYTCKIIAKNRVSDFAERKHKVEASSTTITFKTNGSGK